MIASVSTPDAVDALEAKSRGYLRVLVLDPREVKILLYMKFNLSFLHL